MDIRNSWSGNEKTTVATTLITGEIVQEIQDIFQKLRH